MSNEIVAYFKGRAGVAESVYQYDYGKVLVIDGLILPAVFEAHFANSGDDNSITVIGQDNRVAIPNSCLTKTGIVTVYIYLHSGENDGEVEYVIRFAVTQRVRPAYDSTDEERSMFETALQRTIAMLQNSKKVNTPLDVFGQVTHGIAGQFLRTKGNGATEWVDQGLPTDEQTTNAVNAWLDAHPEATTTVDFSVVSKEFGRVIDMIADRSLTAGDYVATRGFHSVCDGGGAQYLIRSINLDESTDGAFLIGLDNGLVAELIFEKKHINVKWCGAKGDNETDDSDAFNIAIAKANETQMPIYLPYGLYVIGHDLDPVYVGFSIYADGIDTTNVNHKTRIYDQRNDTDTFLFEQDSSLGRVNGGYIQNISFIAIPENELKCIKIISNGWDGKIRDCGFYYYDQALFISGDETKIDRCSFISCGSKRAVERPVYGVSVTGANEKRFDACHFEHSRFFLEFVDEGTGKRCYMNTFTNCKFEQGSTAYSNFASLYPLIYVDCVNGLDKYHNSFLQCDFHCFDINYYINRLEETDYDNVPYFFEESSRNQRCTVFEQCTFTGGPGTGEPFGYYRQSKFAKGKQMMFNRCTFIHPAYSVPSIFMPSNAVADIDDCEFILNTKNPSDYTASGQSENFHILHAEQPLDGMIKVTNNMIRYYVTNSVPVCLANFITEYRCDANENSMTRTVDEITRGIRPIYGKTVAFGGFADEFITLVLVDFADGELNGKFNLRAELPLIGNYIIDVDFSLSTGALEAYKVKWIDSSRSEVVTSVSELTVTLYIGASDNKIYIQIPILNATQNRAIVELHSYFENLPCDWYIDRTIYEELDPSDYSSSVVLYSTSNE